MPSLSTTRAKNNWRSIIYLANQSKGSWFRVNSWAGGSNSPWKPSIMRFEFAVGQRLSGIGSAIAMGDRVRVLWDAGGGRVPERGCWVWRVQPELQLLVPRFALVLSKQRVKALPTPEHRPPLAYGMCLWINSQLNVWFIYSMEFEH